MVEFKEPKVEVITFDTTQVVYASSVIGGSSSCTGQPMDAYCGTAMAASSGACGDAAAAEYPCENNANL